MKDLKKSFILLLTLCNNLHTIKLSRKGRGVIIIFKKIEEIRKDVGYSQTEFAQTIGLSYRSYQDRLNGANDNWRISELIGICDYNNGEVQIQLGGESYNISIKKV